MNINERCVAAAVRGDREAAADLIKSLWPDAYRIAWTALRDDNAAEDAAQEACARAWAALTTVRHADRFPVWFYRIVVNECRRIRRNLRKHQQLIEPPPDTGHAPDDERIDVRRAIDALPDPLRLVVVLRYYHDLTSAEIAKVVGASPITVRWRLMLAHRRVRALLDRPEGNYADETVAFG